jgi:hypothetical protein
MVRLDDDRFDLVRVEYDAMVGVYQYSARHRRTFAI